MKTVLQLRDYLIHEWHHNRKVLLVWLSLRLLVLLTLIRSAMNGQWENVFICLLVLFLFLLPQLLGRRFKINFPSGLQIVIMIHIFASEILGEIGCYYVRYAHWDTITHTVWGFLCAAIGYALVYILNREAPSHFHLSPAFLSIVAFCFSMTIGVLWEFFEFAADRLFLLDMQKDTVIHYFASTLLDPTQSNIPVPVQMITDSAINGQSLGLNGYLDIGLLDTMEDLLVNMLGAIVFSVIGFFQSKSDNAKHIAEQFIPQAMIEEEAQE